MTQLRAILNRSGYKMSKIVADGEEQGVAPVAYCRYESFVKDSNKSIEEKNRDITNKTAEKATAEGDLTAANEVRS